MKNSSKKRYITIAVVFAVIFLAGVAAYLVFDNTNKQTGNYEVVDRGFAICTQDIPTSGCGSWTVTLKSADGKVKDFTVKGFSGGNRAKFQSIGKAVSDAKENNKKLQVTTKGEFIESAAVIK